jgi:hypothetical protein
MARYSCGTRGSVVGTTLRAQMSLFAASGSGCALRQVNVFNTTTTAVCVGLIRFSAATNVGTALTEIQYDPNSPPPLCTAFAGHTADGTTSGGIIEIADLGAAIGSGVMWTFGDTGLRILLGTANGIGLYIPQGTGQICDVTFHWDE